MFLFDRSFIVKILRQIAAGVACMHNADIQHCDLKPDNIFIGRDGDVRIADFGKYHCLKLCPLSGRLNETSTATDCD